MINDLLLYVIISGLLGAFIGLERDVPEKKSKYLLNSEDDSFGGVRTFAIIAILGTMSAWFDKSFGNGYFVLASLFIVSSFILVSHIYVSFKNKDIGITTEIAGVIVYFIGVSCVYLDIKFPVIFTILISIILAAKNVSDKFVSSISRQELIHTMKFAVVSFVILPVLPDKKFSFSTLFDSFGVEGVLSINNNIWQMEFFNPYGVWFFVVAISAIGYIGYLLSKYLGKNGSVIISSIVGGLVSSTAVTAAMSEQSKKDSKNYFLYTVGALLANSIMLLRVIIIVLLINFTLLPTLFIPAFLMFFGLASVTLYFYIKSKKHPIVNNISLEGKVESPFSLKPALKFGLFVLFLKFLAGIGVLYKDIWGESLFYYAFGIISGFADVDAITQTMTVLSKEAKISSSIAVSTILLAVMSNNTVKGLIAIKFGDKMFGKYVMGSFLLSMGLGIMGIIYISF
ncbi:MAG: MgtC/SapB family protein [Candidatus Gracilibacteria bacterium]|nr:MgtC/SapB family protein [Candidatus Gracilibacteria bacterium]